MHQPEHSLAAQYCSACSAASSDANSTKFSSQPPNNLQACTPTVRSEKGWRTRKTWEKVPARVMKMQLSTLRWGWGRGRVTYDSLPSIWVRNHKTHYTGLAGRTTEVHFEQTDQGLTLGQGNIGFHGTIL
jgi:hypothetical protein